MPASVERCRERRMVANSTGVLKEDSYINWCTPAPLT